MRGRSRSFFSASSSDWNGTPSPAPASDSACRRSFVASSPRWRLQYLQVERGENGRERLVTRFRLSGTFAAFITAFNEVQAGNEINPQIVNLSSVTWRILRTCCSHFKRNYISPNILISRRIVFSRHESKKNFGVSLSLPPTLEFALLLAVLQRMPRARGEW